MHSGVAKDHVRLADLAAKGASVAEVAALAVSTWRGIYAVLSPVIGERGVCALYRRSVHIILDTHPWLSDVHDGALTPDEFNSLRTALLGQSAAQAAAAGDALLLTFIDVLTHLIGGSLAERLLRLAGTTSADSPPTGSG